MNNKMVITAYLSIITFNEHELNAAIKNISITGSGQDGGIGRNASLPHTTKRRIKANLKTWKEGLEQDK